MWSTYGYMFSCMFNNYVDALVTIHVGVLLPYFSAGLFTNLSDQSSSRYQFIKFLGTLSPFRYSCEAMIRIMLQGYGPEYVDVVTEKLGY